MILEFTFDDLMRIRSWHFAIRQHRELIPRSVIGMQVRWKLVSFFSIFNMVEKRNRRWLTFTMSPFFSKKRADKGLGINLVMSSVYRSLERIDQEKYHAHMAEADFYHYDCKVFMKDIWSP